MDERYSKALGAAKARAQQNTEPSKKPERTRDYLGDEKPKPPSLSPETIDGMHSLAEKAEQVRQEQKEKEKEEPTKELAVPDTFDGAEPFSYYEALQRLQRNKDSKKRKYVEKLLKPLDIGELLSVGRVEQDVPIADGVIATFRSTVGREELFIKNRISLEDERSSDMYLQSKLGILVLTSGVVCINDRPLPDHINEKLEVDKELFDEKFERVLNLPTPLLTELSINHTWFQERVQGLLTFGALKNG